MIDVPLVLCDSLGRRRPPRRIPLTPEQWDERFAKLLDPDYYSRDSQSPLQSTLGRGRFGHTHTS